MATALCFNAEKWAGKDVGDNSQFWEPVRLLQIYEGCGEALATVRWPDGTESGGHLVSMMKEVNLNA